MAPKRIRLSRAKGWRLPDNAVNVARPSKWGNPFVVGRDGTRAECVELYALMAAGLLCLSCKAEMADQRAVRDHIKKHVADLRGKDLACWCAIDGNPCHADVLLAVANEPYRPGMLDRFLISSPGTPEPIPQALPLSPVAGVGGEGIRSAQATTTEQIKEI